MSQADQERDHGSLLKDALRSITGLVSQHPTPTLWTVVLLACAAAGVTVAYMEFKTKRADLIDPNAGFHQRWIDYTESFGDSSDVIVVVEADNPAAIKQVLDELGTRMSREPELFSNVLYKFEPGRLRQKGLQYLSPQQLEIGLRRLDELSPILHGNWHLLNLASLANRLQRQLAVRSLPASDKQRGLLLQQADLLAASLSHRLDDPADFRSPWPDLLPIDPRLREEARQVVYLMNERGTMGFLKAFPAGAARGFDGQSESIDRLRKLVAQVAAEHSNAKIGVTGIPVLENDEMRRSRLDMLEATVISFVGVGVLLFVGFRGFRHPMLALAMLLIGMAWAFGYTTLVVGHLNILSVSFAVILIGLGIDFSIHYLERYLELRHRGRQLRPALLETAAGVGPGIVTAAVTTALAFFCAILTQFLGVAELGIIAGGGIVLCALATFVVLPALISLSDQHVEPRKLPAPFPCDMLSRLTARFPVTVTLVSAAVIVGIGLRTLAVRNGRVESRIGYDYNLLNLQAEGIESVEVQKRVFQQADNSLLYAVSLADSPEHARKLRTAFERLPSVDHVEELASRLPAYPPQQTQLLVQAYRARLARLPAIPGPLPSADPASVGRALESLFLQMRASHDPLAIRAARKLDAFLDRFERLSLRQQALLLTDYQQRLAESLLRQLHALAAASNAEPIQFADLPAELTSRFVSDRGKWLLQIYPKEQVWDREPLARFVKEVRSIDPDVTGTPLQNYEASRQIKESYETAAVYALAVICLVLLIGFLSRRHMLLTLLPPLAIVGFLLMSLETRQSGSGLVWLVGWYVVMAGAVAAVLDFRSLRDTLLAIVPPFGGGLLMFGILAFLGVDLNPANLIVLPLVLGIGVDDGVHVIHDFRMQNGTYRTSSSTMNAIVLTSLTSMIGFGSMMVAAHRGLYSVGLVLVVGVGSCLFVSLVTLPAILTLVSGGSSRQTAQDAGSSAGQGKPSDDRRRSRAA